MKIVLCFAAILCCVYADGSWRYYPSDDQRWSPAPGQHIHPHGQHFNPPGRFHPPGLGNQRFGNYPFGSNPWLPPNPQFIQDALRGAEWVCRNQQTGDMLVISADEENARVPGNGPQHPGTHQPQHPPWQQPQQPSESGQYPWNQLPTPQPGHTLPDQRNDMSNNPFLNNDGRTTSEGRSPQVTSTEEPVTHQGVGQIDIRMGV